MSDTLQLVGQMHYDHLHVKIGFAPTRYREVVLTAFPMRSK